MTGEEFCQKIMELCQELPPDLRKLPIVMYDMDADLTCDINPRFTHTALPKDEWALLFEI